MYKAHTLLIHHIPILVVVLIVSITLSVDTSELHIIMYDNFSDVSKSWFIVIFGMF